MQSANPYIRVCTLHLSDIKNKKCTYRTITSLKIAKFHSLKTLTFEVIMLISHKIDDFLFNFFPNITKDQSNEDLISELEKYYTYGPFKPKVTIADNIIQYLITAEYYQNSK